MNKVNEDLFDCAKRACDQINNEFSNLYTIENKGAEFENKLKNNFYNKFIDTDNKLIYNLFNQRKITKDVDLVSQNPLYTSEIKFYENKTENCQLCIKRNGVKLNSEYRENKTFNLLICLYDIYNIKDEGKLKCCKCYIFNNCTYNKIIQIKRNNLYKHGRRRDDPNNWQKKELSISINDLMTSNLNYDTYTINY